MFTEIGWDLDKKDYVTYKNNDNSQLAKFNEVYNQDEIFVGTADAPINLGIHRFRDTFFTSSYVGICRLKDRHGKNVRTQDGRDAILQIEPRFPLSVTSLLNYVKEDDEFDRYMAPQTNRLGTSDRMVESAAKNEIIYFFDDEPPILVNDGIALENGIITVTAFLYMLKQLCKRPLMGRMVKKEENLVGKVKGKIVIGKNLRINAIKGREDRFYCQYLRYSEDIIENQVLKLAYEKAKRFIVDSMPMMVARENTYQELISFCNKSMGHISLNKLAYKEADRLKLSGCYAYYGPVIKMASMILKEISVEPNGVTRLSNYVIPYAVSMEKLFEVYVRAYLKRNEILSFKDDHKSGIRMSKFDERKKVLLGEAAENTANYIGGTVKPDIILQNTDNLDYCIFDVKYKDYTQREFARNDRLQLLAYSLIYGTDKIGIVFPTQDDQVSCIFEPRDINISGKYARTVKYHEMLLSIKADESSNEQVAEYIKNLF